MVSSDSVGGGVMGRVGSIVWVRRRNGSWWPGKILGPEDLAASHLMSPRSGTPVKLLGREDASVDWYNLEKSKRVKTFRCGEFDDCIERAEGSSGLPSKKREKYARREDAILHALELERELHEKKYGKVGATSSIKNNSCGSAAKDLHTPSGALRNCNGKHENMELQQFHRKAISHGDDECNSYPLSLRKGEGGAWKSVVNSETQPLMVSSQDFTLPKKIVSGSWSPSHKAIDGDQAQVVSAAGVYLGSIRNADFENSVEKGKGLLDYSIEESSLKWRDRHHPLAQELQNSSTWPSHSLHPHGDTLFISGVNNPGEDGHAKRSRLSYMHSQYTDTMDIEGDDFNQMENLTSYQGLISLSNTDVIPKDDHSVSSENTESDSHSSKTDPKEQYTPTEMVTYSDVNTPMSLQSEDLSRLEMQGLHASISNEESDESSPGKTLHFHQNNPHSLDTGLSQWQLKGKRNVRSFSRKSFEKFTNGSYLEPRSLAQRYGFNPSYYHGHEGCNNEVDFIEDDPELYVEGYGIRRDMWKPHDTPRRCNGSSMIDWEELTWRNNSFRGCTGYVFGGLHGEELLLDVDLKVQTNHRREHVPFVSLMSRLNGKPIIGHPIQIETLGDGSTDALLSSIGAFENFESDEGGEVSPLWATARRTSNFRVPRPPVPVSPQTNDVNNQHVDEDSKTQSRKPVSGNTLAKNNLAVRKSPHVPKLSSPDRMKPPKRLSSSSSQKTRPLSSLGMNQMLVSEPKHSGLIGYMDGVIKPLDSGPPIVACIPVKLVFSRLLESIGRPPSMPSTHNVFSEQK